MSKVNQRIRSMLGQSSWMFMDDWDASIAKTAGAIVLDDNEWSHHAFIPGKGDDSNILVVAHMDSVAKPSQPRFKKQSFYAPTVDNRIGFWIATKWLPSIGIYPDVLLTDHEEMASSTAKFFKTEKKYRWMVQFDRMNMDVATYQYGTEEMDKAIESVNMKPTYGSYTCICDLEDLGCAGFNWGVGYRDYHGPGAHVNLDELTHNLRAFKKFWDSFSQHTFKFEVTKYRSYGHYGLWDSSTTYRGYSRSHDWYPNKNKKWTGGINGKWVGKDGEKPKDYYVSRKCFYCQNEPTHVSQLTPDGVPYFFCDEHVEKAKEFFDDEVHPLKVCFRCGTKRGGEEAAQGRSILAQYWWKTKDDDCDLAICHWHYEKSDMKDHYPPAPHWAASAEEYDMCEWCGSFPAEHLVQFKGTTIGLCTNCAVWWDDEWKDADTDKEGNELAQCDLCGDYNPVGELSEVTYLGRKQLACNDCCLQQVLF